MEWRQLCLCARECARRNSLAGLLPYQCPEHGSVRAHVDYRRSWLLCPLCGGVYRPDLCQRQPAQRRRRDQGNGRRPRALHDHPELVEERLQPGHETRSGLPGRNDGMGRWKPRLEGDDEVSSGAADGTMRVEENQTEVGHEATVSKVGDDQLFYLMSRGLDESEAYSLIVNGFIEPITKELPMEYAVELNRLIQLEMSGSVG